MTRLLTLLTCFTFGFSLPAGATPPTEPPAATPAPPARERVVAARVGGAELTVADLMQFAALNPQRVRFLASGAQGRAEVLRMLIANVLIQQAMADEGLLQGTSDPETLQKAYQAFSQKHFAIPDELAEPDLREYYENHLHLFGIPAASRISQIQFRFPADADSEAKAETMRRAEAALDRINAGEDFSAVAADITDNENARETKGDLGFIPRETWSPWLSNALDGVDVGEHTGIIPSPIGYEILKVTDTRAGMTSPFEDVRDKVNQRLRAEREAELRDAYVKRLAEKTEIVIELDNVQEFFADGVFPEP
jgi:parvulin-like peptidyl-prolyl isomerase